MSKVRTYPTDLNDQQWAFIRSYYPPAKGRPGRPPSRRLRQTWNAILYITKTGCQWRMLPRDFPAWQTVYYHFNRLKGSGKLEEITQVLNEKARIKKGDPPSPSLGIVDSQSVKSRSGKKNSERI
jgi:transposase